jgi:hypothetical protein
MSKEFIIRKDGMGKWKTNALRDYLNELPEGKYKIVVQKADKRSNDQNSYYWQILELYVYPGLYDLGWRQIKSKEDAHDFMREMFLKTKEINNETGEERMRIKSTTELTKMQFSEYLQEIWQWAAEYLSITIPAPNEQLKLNDYYE